METNRSEQLEALQVMLDYLPKLSNGMKTVATELAGTSLPDTDTYLSKIIEGLNWVIQIVNLTLPVINENSTVIDKNTINDSIVRFSTAYTNKDNTELANLLNGELLNLVTTLETEVAKLL